MITWHSEYKLAAAILASPFVSMYRDDFGFIFSVFVAASFLIYSFARSNEIEALKRRNEQVTIHDEGSDFEQALKESTSARKMQTPSQ